MFFLSKLTFADNSYPNKTIPLSVLSVDKDAIDDYWMLVLQQGIGIISAISPENEYINDTRDKFVKNILDLLFTIPLGGIETPWQYIGCCSLGYYAIYHGYEDLLLRQLLARLYSHVSQPLLQVSVSSMGDSVIQ